MTQRSAHNKRAPYFSKHLQAITSVMFAASGIRRWRLKRWARARSCAVQVCGLKWSYDDRELASGGNDNHLFVWNASSPSPVLKFTEHTAAVKAISWSPHQHGLLASGARGDARRCGRLCPPTDPPCDCTS